MKNISKNTARMFRFVLLLCAGLALAACDNAEERAEKHFQNAMALLAEGDADRAVVEFRNVFKLNGNHRDARAAYAKLRREEGEFEEALSQYLRLAEQYPSDAEANTALAEMYAEVGGWAEMTRFLDVLAYAAEGEFETRALQQVQRYFLAVEARDTEAATDAAVIAETLLEEQPDYPLLHQVVVDGAIAGGDLEGALNKVDVTIGLYPESQQFYAVRLSILAALGDALGIEKQLIDNVARFPDEDSYGAALIQYYISQGLYDQAEGFLRQRADGAVEQREPRLELVHFLLQVRGSEAALAELNNIIEAGESDSVYLATRASIMFDNGQTEAAMADITSRIAQLGQGDELDRLRVTLANMQLLQGDEAAARETVAMILAEDGSNIEALKLQAEFLISDDRTGEAIATLRTALDEVRDDPEIYTTLALAHQRDGNTDLVADMLALAVDASDQAAPESLRYVRLLLSEERPGPAESVAIDALRRDPTNSELLFELGRVYLLMRDWGRVDQIIATLRNLVQGEVAETYANELQTMSLTAQSKSSEVIEFLESVVDAGNATFETDIAIVRTYVDQGNIDAARAYVAEQLQVRAGDLGLRFLDATIDTAAEAYDDAERKYLALLEEEPSQESIWMATFRMYQQMGNDAKMRAIVDRGLEALPDSNALLWLKASVLEADGDIEGAIAVYEAMYAADSDNEVVANNLASLLVSLRQDPETVNRAFVIARRLRDAQLPPFQDTYGWIAVLRGDFKDAIRSLEPAASGMSDDPTVQYHLARAYEGDNRNFAALETYRMVLSLVDANDQRDFVVDSRARIEELLKLPELSQ